VTATHAATLAILAGGEGSRMGRPKGELRVDGQPILAYLLDRFQWNGPTLLVTAPGRERPPGAEGFDREVSDPVAGEGPLRGVITALEATQTDFLLVASCDMPMIGSPQLTWLAENLSAHPDSPFIMPARHGYRLETLPVGVRRTSLPQLLGHLTTGQRSLHSLFQIEGARAAAIPDCWDESVWTNLNAPQDLEDFLRGLSS
jgi:molybdenum cofactor guanylyltransferase